MNVNNQVYRLHLWRCHWRNVFEATVRRRRTLFFQHLRVKARLLRHLRMLRRQPESVSVLIDGRWFTLYEVRDWAKARR